MWSCLGAYRGHKLYMKEVKYTGKYYYVSDVFISALGAGIYIFPPAMPISGIYELYKLEEKIRGIEDQ
jgi:hypothetical protein